MLKFAKIINFPNFREALPICELQLCTYMRCTARAHYIIIIFVKIIFVNAGLITKYYTVKWSYVHSTSKYLSLFKVFPLLITCDPKTNAHTHV